MVRVKSKVGPRLPPFQFRQREGFRLKAVIVKLLIIFPPVVKNSETASLGFRNFSEFGTRIRHDQSKRDRVRIELKRETDRLANRFGRFL